MNPLKEQRAKAGLTVRKLAELSDVHFTTIHDLESGKRKATVATLGKIAKALGIDWKLLSSLSKEPVEPENFRRAA